MTVLALALAAGAALPSVGVPPLPAALILLAACPRRVPPFHRPEPRVRWLPLAGLAGLLHGAVATGSQLDDCRWRLSVGDLEVAGWVREVEGEGRVVLEARAAGCTGEIRLQGGAVAEALAGRGEGSGLRAAGRWVPRAAAEPGVDPLRAGVLLVRYAERTSDAASGLGARLARVRAAGVARVHARFPREAPLVAALLFARRDGLDRDLRDAFADTGTAHLLAISGFHVGVFAGVVIWIAGRVLPVRRAVTLGAVAAWLYVATLGFPDAATRAVLLLTLVSVGRWLGRPVSAAGALGTALIALVLLDPAVASRIGAQLSFAGALGLAGWARPSIRGAVAGWTRWRGELPPARARPLVEGLVVTVVATLATLPLIAWHFERVSLVAVPASLLATPLVAIALPTTLLALVLDALHLPGAAIASTGAEGLLGLLRTGVGLFASLPGAAVPLARPATLAACAGVGVGWAIVRSRSRVGFATRAGVLGSTLVAGLIAWPVSLQVGRNGSLEVHLFDVGQGDAIGIRTPRGRWLVVDAGPPSGARLVSDLRRAGAREVEVLLITHPDADHVGGAAAILTDLSVGAVVGPGTIRGDGPWQEAVRAARDAGVPWRVLAEGDSLRVDGVGLRVLHPPRGDARPLDANAASLMMLLEWRGVEVLLTGDAPVDAEARIVRRIGPIDILKVGHHGSHTSTGPALLDRLAPQVALISVGRGNRYGHPAPEVLARLRERGVEVWRTDESGSVVVDIDAGGHWTVRGSR
ncbi:DNA internalization-related competence protein ComEC/Rec2 [Gaopeijia maritima]|uniref:DNA internalization-related competence protein ComEC/Rec2 n=1 Tax=Gaopeijia maritima TaxID=3119007 RepID=A0ABU9ED54_9BACT